MAKPKTQKPIEGQVRLVCTLPNASARISGVAFATVTLEEQAGPVHLSERVDAAVAERFVATPGFQVWDGDEDAHARAIEDALDASRRTAPVAGGRRRDTAVEGELRRQVEELTRANQAQAVELRTQRQQLEQLRAANTALTEELNKLKATGVRAAA